MKCFARLIMPWHCLWRMQSATSPCKLHFLFSPMPPMVDASTESKHLCRINYDRVRAASGKQTVEAA